MKTYDYIIVGAGIGGITTGALLTKSGASVCILEQHSVPGGYGHSFKRKGYVFCAEIHYIWNCGPNEDGEKIFNYLGLEDTIKFISLNPDCIDKLNFPGLHYEIVKGFDRNIDQLSSLFPDHYKNIHKYFQVIGRLHDEMKLLPFNLSIFSVLSRPTKFWNIIKYRNTTTKSFFQQLNFPRELQAILAGQSGNLLIQPERASLLIHAAMVTGIDIGACVPETSYKHVFDSLTGVVQKQSDCDIFYKTKASSIKHTANRVDTVVDSEGNEYKGKNIIFNGDPKLISSMMPEATFPRPFKKKMLYDYSPSAFTVYLGLKDLDLTKHGFGDWNVWHYADTDINAIFNKQLIENDMETPSLFISTPTLHKDASHIAPDGCHQMIICTICDYEYMKSFKEKGREAYLAEKDRITDIILDEIEKHYVPEFRKYIDVIVSGTPTTMEDFVAAPKGNSYGADLSPENFNLGKLNYKTPYENLFLIGATSGAPSFAGGLHFSALLFEKLTGEDLLEY